MALPHTTFIIVTFNNQETIERCIEHILEQQGNYSVLVVDNDSSDNTCQVISQYDEKVELYQTGANPGFARGNNIGIGKAVDSDFVALINPDAFIAPGWLSVMIEAATTYTQAASFGSLQLAADGETIDGCGDVLHFTGHAWRRWQGRTINEVEVTRMPIFSPCAAAAFYRREAMQQVGGFDEDFFCYFEDVDLGARLQLAGYESMLIPEARAIHLGFGSSGDFSKFAIYHGHRNLVWSFIQNTPLPLLILLFPVHIVASLIVQIGFLLTGKGVTFFKARIHAIAGALHAWKKRRKIAVYCKISSWEYAKKLTWWGFIPRGFRAIKRRVFRR